ncbi:hypothetical protein GP486_004464 [Trichoglossum hirsutum]|uniref:SUZ domain-containing protein n=1 Tax=Trichoglossum hirsutum TaxID=265104 RepID=A0A9P8LAT6_9PEZI|nr:hypothetical protein GP486_004464 [Trichoglossum hirsutum]
MSNPVASTGSTPPPNAPAMKIMRRAAAADKEKEKEKQKQTSDGESENVLKSEPPSKAASEVGADSASDGDKDGTISRAESVSAKEKPSMTREEREAKYREARERIFKGFKESSENHDDGSGIADGKDMSRASSNSGQDKSQGAGSRGGNKQRIASDDGFEARSQFNVYYPSAQYPAPPFAGTAPYGPFSLPPNNTGGQVGGMPFGGVHQQYLSPIPQPVPPNGMPQLQVQQQMLCPGPVSGARGPAIDQTGYQQFFQFPQNNAQPVQLPQNNTQGLQQPSIQQQIPMIGANATTNFGSNRGRQLLQNGQQWTHLQPPHQNQFQGQGFTQHQHQHMDRRGYSSPGNMPSQPQAQYPFGQLPNKPFVPGSSFTRQQHQHPIPGSYNRQPFNPLTQSFVPGGSFSANQTGTNGSQLYPSPVPGQFGGVPNMTSGFPRQAPNHNSTNYAPHQPPAGNLNGGTLPNQYSGAVSQQGPPPVKPPNLNHPPRQTQGGIAKWGSSSLPKKPPPPNIT